MRLEDLTLPVLANVFVLSPASPVSSMPAGSPVSSSPTSSSLWSRARRGARQGRAFFVDLAARVAVARGLGFSGVYLGGHLSAADYDDLLDRADALAGDDWRALAREIQLRLSPTSSTSSSPTRIRGSPRTSSTRRISNRAQGQDGAARAARYRFSRRLHTAAFEPDAPLFRPGARCTARSSGPRPSEVAATRSSRPPRSRCSTAATAATARCRTSPTSAPSRSARRTSATGRAAAPATASARSTTRSASGRTPTSGSRPTARRSRCSTGPVIVKDNALARTSAWANTFLGRDHHGRSKRRRRPADWLSMERRLSYLPPPTACCVAA